jgi:hypothetical protein
MSEHGLFSIHCFLHVKKSENQSYSFIVFEFYPLFMTVTEKNVDAHIFLLIFDQKPRFHQRIEIVFNRIGFLVFRWK